MEKGIQRRRILINAFMSLVQVVVLGGVLFIFYRFLLRTIGVEQLGIWSVVLSTTSIAGIANLGLTGSVVKFVAKYIAREENEIVSGIIQTAIISIGIIIGFLLLIGYPIIKWVLGLIIPYNNLEQALSILPYSLISLWIMIIFGVLQSGIDGHQRIDIRSVILMAGALFHLILAFFLVPSYGLIGLAYARVIQASLLLLTSWVILKRLIPPLPIFPYKWDRKLFREMLGYGLNFQVISIVRMLCGPTTKALLSRFGGLSMVGFYEMATRMVMQIRSLLVSVNQVLVPAIADLQEKEPNLIQNIYKDNYRLMVYIALPLYSLIIACTPLISKIWIGHYESIFVIFSILLAVSLFINALSVPAYFSYLGIGILKWNTLGYVTTAFMNVALGLMIGIFFGGIGVVLAWVISSITGSLIIAISYNCKYTISLRELLPRENMGVAIACLIATLSALFIYYLFNHTFTLTIGISITIITFSIIVFIPLWFHPMRNRIMRQISSELLNKKSGVELEKKN